MKSLSELAPKSTSRPAPLPEVEALKLLYVTNGSPLTADRWWQAHRYYQHRQNLHYQSLHHPGIVCGLGVRVVSPPETVPSVLRDQRWIEIQPGIAIDLVGNPIVVETPMTFRVTSKVVHQPITVYVVLAYVNPREKQWASLPADVVKEEFRINERKLPPESMEVELCRIQITDNNAPLTDASNVFSPAPHALDLRHRQLVKARAQHSFQIGTVASEGADVMRDRLSALTRSIEGLYPALSDVVITPPITLEEQTDNLQQVEPKESIALLAFPYQRVLQLTETELYCLHTHVAAGGSLLIEYTADDDGKLRLCDLQTIRRELKAAIGDIQQAKTNSEFEQASKDLETELSACAAAIDRQLHQISQPVRQLMQWLQDTSAIPTVSESSSPTQYPFAFDQLPKLPTGEVSVLAWEGVILTIGALSAAWMPGQFEVPLTREAMRSAQELGINILYQASCRQQMRQAQQPIRTDSTNGLSHHGETTL